MEIYKKTAAGIVIGSLVGFIGYYGYSTFNKYYQIYNMISDIKVNDEKPSVIIKEDYMIIKYVYLNDEYTLRVPYDQDMVATMTQYEVYGLLDDGTEIKLTQQPGVPYLVKAKALQCSHITVYDLGEDEQRHYYDIPPFYGNVEE